MNFLLHQWRYSDVNVITSIANYRKKNFFPIESFYKKYVLIKQFSLRWKKKIRTQFQKITEL